MLSSGYSSKSPEHPAASSDDAKAGVNAAEPTRQEEFRKAHFFGPRPHWASNSVAMFPDSGFVQELTGHTLSARALDR